MPRPNRIGVSPEDIRERFDRGGFVDRAIRDRFSCCLKKAIPCRAPTEPTGTLSATLEFHDPEGIFVFMVHCYVRPDGRIGASGKVDPKSLVDDDGTEYFVWHGGGTGGTGGSLRRRSIRPSRAPPPHGIGSDASIRGRTWG